ncbi:hypothetical protein [Kitasatospora sp. NPDC047058]|uniref:hypothetical protein n=1 Tax=Kitasatospora sp. NPDC047058 TaxID=3155620 RepID=UPI003405FD09
MSADITELLTQAGPLLTGALTTYGTAVLTRAENAAMDAAVDATADSGRRFLQRVWRRGDAARRAELETAVEAADEDPEAVAAALRLHLRRVLAEDAELRQELADLLAARPTPSITITAHGERSIAAYSIGTAVTGDGHRVGS